MVEINPIVKEIKLTKDGTFDFENMYKIIKDWYSFHQYDFFEKEYSDVIKEDSKDIKAHFNSEKKISDYVKYEVQIKLTVKNHRIVVAPDKKKKLVHGELIISISSSIKSDFEGQWEEKPFKKFIRGIYDKFIEGDKNQRFASELKEETYSLYNELKAFLNLQRF